MIPTTTIGIDISKKSLDCTLFRSSTQQLVWTDRFANNPEGIAALLSRAPSDATFVAEPTGRYGHVFIQTAQRKGRTVLLAPNRQARLYLRSMNPRAKNDRLDSRGLARFATAKELLPYTLKSQPVEEIDQLLSVRKALSGTITRFRLQVQELPFVADQVAPIVAELKVRLAEIDKKIALAVRSDPAFEVARRLQQIPGVGPVTAAAVTSRLIAKGFVSADAFVAYTGLDITVSQSGQNKGQGRLSKQGDAELRRLLYCAAQANLRCKQSPFKDLYTRQRAKGLASTKALCVVARKLAKVCWSIGAHETTYDPDRVFSLVPERAIPFEESNVSRP
jgi:transposase